MSDASTLINNKYKHVEEVISDPLRFKGKLAIGEDAYKALRIKRRLWDVIDTAGAVGTGVSIAKSAYIANTFFASTSFWSFLGVGATAATPIGWVIAAGTLSGAAFLGIKYASDKATDERVFVAPHFINTPMDALGASLFGLFAPLALKIAHVDNEIDNLERDHIYIYLRNEWGFNDEFLKVSLSEIENNIEQYKISDLSSQLIEFTKSNPDCNQKAIIKDIINFLKDVMSADNVIDPREEAWISKIESWLTGKESIPHTKQKLGVVEKLRRSRKINKFLRPDKQ